MSLYGLKLPTNQCPAGGDHLENRKKKKEEKKTALSHSQVSCLVYALHPL